MGRLLLAGILTVVLCLAPGANAQEATPRPDGVTLAPVESDSVEALLDLAPLVSIVRVQRLQGGATGYSESEERREGPRLLLVEEGTLTVISSETERGPVLLRRAADGPDSLPLLVTPDTEVDLGSGDMLFMPDDAGPIFAFDEGSLPTYLDVRIFPDSPPPTTTDESEVNEPLDLDLGVATARPLAPEGIEVHRLEMLPSASWVQSPAPAPMLVLVTSGELEVAAGEQEVPVKRADAPYDAPVEAVVARSSGTLAAGDAAFVQVGTDAVLSNAGDGPLSGFVVSFGAGTAEQATPAA
jgi:hypothetical protein